MKNLYMKKDKNFNTILVRILFPFILKKEDILKKTILPSMLVYTNEKNPNEEDFRKELSKHGIFTITASIIEIGKQFFLSFTLIIPDKKTIKEDLLEDALCFFLDTIYHPNKVEGAFEERLFEKEKRRLKRDIENVFHNITSYNNYKIWNFLDPKEEYIVSSINHKDQLEQLTTKDVYNFYEKIVYKKKPFIFLYGDFIKKTAKRTIQNYLEKEKVVFPKDFHPIYQDMFTKEIEKEIKIEEKKPFNQSKLTYVYQIKEATREDEVLLNCINRMLSYDAIDLLMKKLRDELGIVYTTSSRIIGEGSLLFITANIYKENKKEAEKGIEEVIELLKDKTKVEVFLKEVKEEIKIERIQRNDSANALFNNYIEQIMKTGKGIEELYDKMLEVKIEDITTFVKRFQKILTCFIEGEENE